MRTGLLPAAGTWHVVDEEIDVSSGGAGESSAPPSELSWRGSTWHVTGPSLHWTTWRALPIPVADPGTRAGTKRLTSDFWRFTAQLGGTPTTMTFEIRRVDRAWRIVRLRVPVPLVSQEHPGRSE